MLIETSAPARANLIGNPSDQYGGCTLACSVPLRARVVLDEQRAGWLECDGERAELRGVSDLALRGDSLDIARAALAAFGIAQPAFGVRYESEIPRQSGLAGSTALFVALAQALAAWQGRRLSLHALAELARELEAHGLGVQCGYVDQYACTFGGLCHVLPR